MKMIFRYEIELQVAHNW